MGYAPSDQNYENLFHRKGAKNAKNPIFEKIGFRRFYERTGRLSRDEAQRELSGLSLASRQRKIAPFAFFASSR
jgi:hypothetical protein